MRKESLFSGLLLLSFFANGCAHMSENHSRGAIVLTDSKQEAQACIRRGEVKVGEIIDVIKTSCTKVNRPTKINPDSTNTVCKNEFVGEAEVLALSDEHFVKIKTIGALNFEQGMSVEIKKNQK